MIKRIRKSMKYRKAMDNFIPNNVLTEMSFLAKNTPTNEIQSSLLLEVAAKMVPP